VWIPIRIRIAPPSSAAWMLSAHATAARAEENAQKNASPCVSTSAPP
jgi:hypothetical protein